MSQPERSAVTSSLILFNSFIFFLRSSKASSHLAIDSSVKDNTGKVLALDIHPHRVEIMKKYLTSLQLTNVTCVCYDSTKLHEKSKLIGSFDKVLLDAPCLGLGVIRRKPDILLDVSPTKLDEIVDLQKKLLESAKR